MNANLPDRRAAFLLDVRRVDQLKQLVDPLKDAPLRVRRLGLPLALAAWSREGHDRLVQLLADWLFRDWGMVDSGTVPQGVSAFLDRLMDEEASSPALRSAMEVEAEELLQAAKLISDALAGTSHG